MAASTSTARRAIVALCLLTAAVVVFAVVYYAFASDDVVDDGDGASAYLEDGAGMPVDVPPENVPPGLDVLALAVVEAERGLLVVGRVRNTSERTIEEVSAYVDLRATSGIDDVETVVAVTRLPIAPGGTGSLEAAATSEEVAAAALRRIDAR